MPPKVLLVGAGPGPADLLTLRAARAIASAQAVLYDALVSDEVLALAPAACVKIQTGKRGGRPSLKQSTINRLMIRLARRGLNVVRLKGGDPSVFGRVGEEQDALSAQGVASEVIPGVTAASAAAAQFGFPLTHRGEARRLVLTTATLSDGAVSGDWAAAADHEATLAIYMGAQRAGAVASGLMAAGRSPSTPVCAIERAGAVDAQLRRGVLSDLQSLVADLGEGPILMVVGEVTARAGLGHADLCQEDGALFERVGAA
jgi:uroporphyrin-III C-methyltransferase